MAGHRGRFHTAKDPGYDEARPTEPVQLPDVYGSRHWQQQIQPANTPGPSPPQQRTESPERLWLDELRGAEEGGPNNSCRM